MLSIRCDLARTPTLDQRRRERLRVSVGAKVRSPSGQGAAVIRDVTVFGCRLETGEQVSPGERVRVAVPGFQPFASKVVWVSDGFAGIEFEQPLHPAVVDHIVRSFPPAG